MVSVRDIKAQHNKSQPNTTQHNNTTQKITHNTVEAINVMLFCWVVVLGCVGLCRVGFGCAGSGLGYQGWELSYQRKEKNIQCYPGCGEAIDVAKKLYLIE